MMRCCDFSSSQMESYDYVDTTPATSTRPPRAMILGAGIDSASTRTFMPVVLQTSTNAYNQNLYMMDQYLHNNLSSSDSSSTLPTSKDISAVEDEMDDEIEKESFRRLVNKEGYCSRCESIKQQARMNAYLNQSDQLGNTSSTLNTAIQNHLISNSSDPSDVIAQTFDDYLKSNTDPNPTSAFAHGELSSSICTPDACKSSQRKRPVIIQGDKEISVGNNRVIERPIKQSSSLTALILVIAMILFAVVMLLYFTNLTSFNNSNFQKFIRDNSYM